MYNFHNVAIKCDTWQQMEQLAEIAREQGLKVDCLEPDCFPEMPYFTKSSNEAYLSHYSVFSLEDTEISFEDFMRTSADPAAYSTYKQSVLTHLPTGDIQVFAASPDGEMILSELYLPFEYDEDDLRVVAEKVIEAFEAQ